VSLSETLVEEPGYYLRDTLKPSLVVRHLFPTDDGPGGSNPTPPYSLIHRQYLVRPPGGLPVGAKLKRRSGGPLGDKWAGRPFEGIQGRKPCMAGRVKTGRM